MSRGRGIRRLSTGEFRQVIIAREAGRGLPLAVMDGPFEGLDEEARSRVMGVPARWRLFWRTAVLIVNRLEAAFPGVPSRALDVTEGRFSG